MSLSAIEYALFPGSPQLLCRLWPCSLAEQTASWAWAEGIQSAGHGQHSLKDPQYWGPQTVLHSRRALRILKVIVKHLGPLLLCSGDPPQTRVLQSSRLPVPGVYTIGKAREPTAQRLRKIPEKDKGRQTKGRINYGEGRRGSEQHGAERRSLPKDDCPSRRHSW